MPDVSPLGARLPQEDVRRRQRHVAVLRSGYVDQKRQYRRDMDPVEHDRRRGCRQAERIERPRERAGDRPPCRGRTAEDPEGRLQQHGPDDGQNQDVDDRRVALARPDETRGTDDVALVGSQPDAGHQNRKDVLQQADPGASADRIEREAGKQTRPEGLDDRSHQYEKTGEDQGMENAGKRTPQQLAMQSDRFEHTGEPRPDPVQPVGRACAGRAHRGGRARRSTRRRRSAGATAPASASRRLGLQTFGQSGHEIEQIAGRAIMGRAEDRGLRVGVDRDDQVRAAHALEMLGSAGDAERQIELRLHFSAGLADLPELRQPAVVHDGSAAGDLRRARRPLRARA